MPEVFSRGENSLIIKVDFCLLRISCLWGGGMHPMLWRHIIPSHCYPSSQVLEGGASSRWVDACVSTQVCGTVARYQEMIFLLSNLLFVKHRMQVIYKVRWSRVSSMTRWSHHLLARSEMLLWLSFPTSCGLFSVPYFLLMSAWLHPLFFLLYYWILVCTHHISLYIYLSMDMYGDSITWLSWMILQILWILTGPVRYLLSENEAQALSFQYIQCGGWRAKITNTAIFPSIVTARQYKLSLTALWWVPYSDSTATDVQVLAKHRLWPWCSFKLTW